MTVDEIALGWERAEALALQIWEAYVLGKAIEAARQAQKTLKEWLDFVRANDYCYNGSLDEYVTLKFF